MKMSNSLIRPALAMFVLLAAVAAPTQVFADDSDTPGITSGMSLGGRAMYYRPKDADSGNLSGGAQLRLHFTPVLAIEGSVDYRKEALGPTTVDIYPVQASVLVYLTPSYRLSPYVLGGAGWYYTHTRSPYEHTQSRFGPHVGAGAELMLNRFWSVDSSYRYLWNKNVDAAGGRTYNDNGFMITAALNYHF